MTQEKYREQIAQMSKTMFRYCLSRTNSYHDAEDLTQEILLISCKGENSFPNEKAFYAFVWRTSNIILKKWYHDIGKHSAEELDEKLSDGSWEALEEQTAENEQLSLITRELAHLNSNYRRTTVAYYVEGLSVKEIAERFSLTQSMVKYLRFQSRKRIKEGIDMERNFGKLSYDPIELELIFWGRNNKYYNICTKVMKNILMACYYDKLNEEQISLQLGVPTAYLEDDLKTLSEYDLLCEKNGFYQSNVPIITKDVMDEIFRKSSSELKEAAESIRAEIDSIMNDVRDIGFYGSNMSANTLKWMLVSQILHLAYIDKTFDDKPLDFPTDIFGDKCFRFFTEKTPTAPYSIGTSTNWNNDGLILFWDVAINGTMLHPRLNESRGNILCKLISSKPQTENEKIVCSELVEAGLALRTDDGIKPNFPCFTAEQGAELNGMINGIASKLSESVLSRTENMRRVLCDHAPSHLEDYVSKMAVLLHYKETEKIMQQLCESGWLLPINGGISGTTVMYLNK